MAVAGHGVSVAGFVVDLEPPREWCATVHSMPWGPSFGRERLGMRVRFPPARSAPAFTQTTWHVPRTCEVSARSFTCHTTKATSVRGGLRFGARSVRGEPLVGQLIQ
jgi:hypothetical protein